MDFQRLVINCFIQIYFVMMNILNFIKTFIRILQLINLFSNKEKTHEQNYKKMSTKKH